MLQFKNYNSNPSLVSRPIEDADDYDYDEESVSSSTTTTSTTTSTTSTTTSTSTTTVTTQTPTRKTPKVPTKPPKVTTTTPKVKTTTTEEPETYDIDYYDSAGNSPEYAGEEYYPEDEPYDFDGTPDKIEYCDGKFDAFVALRRELFLFRDLVRKTERIDKQ